MRTSSGFDRLSTDEELHQVFAVLEEFSHNGWSVPASDAADSQAATLFSGTVLENDDSADAESLAQLMTKRPELKN